VANGTVVEAVVGVRVRSGAFARGAKGEVLIEIRDAVAAAAAGTESGVLGGAVAVLAGGGAAGGLKRFETFFHALWGLVR